jgi:hypothetical protein
VTTNLIQEAAEAASPAPADRGPASAFLMRAMEEVAADPAVLEVEVAMHLEAARLISPLAGENRVFLAVVRRVGRTPLAPVVGVAVVLPELLPAATGEAEITVEVVVAELEVVETAVQAGSVVVAAPAGPDFLEAPGVAMAGLAVAEARRKMDMWAAGILEVAGCLAGRRMLLTVAAAQP